MLDGGNFHGELSETMSDVTGTSASSEILSKPTSHRHAQTSTPASTESLKAPANFGSMALLGVKFDASLRCMTKMTTPLNLRKPLGRVPSCASRLWLWVRRGIWPSHPQQGSQIHFHKAIRDVLVQDGSLGPYNLTRSRKMEIKPAAAESRFPHDLVVLGKFRKKSLPAEPLCTSSLGTRESMDTNIPS